MHVCPSSYDSIFELVTGEYLFDPKECSAGGRLVYEREEDLLAHHQVFLFINVFFCSTLGEGSEYEMEEDERR